MCRLNLATTPSRSRRRWFGWLALVGVGAWFSIDRARPAQAQAAPATVTVRPREGAAGVVFIFRGVNFEPNETVSTAVTWPNGNVEPDVLFAADANGAVDFGWDSTGAGPGRYLMTATGAASGKRASPVPFTVH